MIIFTLLFWIGLFYLGFLATTILIGGIVGSGLWDKIKSPFLFLAAALIFSRWF